MEEAVSCEGIGQKHCANNLTRGVDPERLHVGGIWWAVERFKGSPCEEEAMNGAGSIVVTGDVPCLVDAGRNGVGAAGLVDRGIDAVFKQKAVQVERAILVGANDLTRVVDPQRHRGDAARRGDQLVSPAAVEVAMIKSVGANVITDDLAHIIDS